MSDRIDLDDEREVFHRCPYCQGGILHAEGGRSYRCTDCESREDDREAYDDERPVTVALARIRDGYATIIDADPDGPDFQVQVGLATYSRMEAYLAKREDGTDVFCGWEWGEILEAVRRFNMAQQGVEI